VSDFRFLAPRNFSDLRNLYSSAEPFPHIEIDNFLIPSVALTGSQKFPSQRESSWVHYSHFNEDKCAITNVSRMPDFFRELIAELNSHHFIESLEKLTGVSNLKADPTLQGGGLHLTKRGGFLNIHADFTAHPIQRSWQRQVNLLLYFNQNWTESYEGHLELWSRDMKNCVRKISPVLNKCVIFNTDTDSFHGVPEPLNCPPEITRNSLALYFYTETKTGTKAKLRATNYRARPNQKDKKIIIWLDKVLVATYTRTKSKLGISDQTIGVLLKKLRKNKD
jgi:Rps23 Pro-64 3,4-dihydroxylase Tpa1-like proline 4-hydroxylase